MENHKEHNHTHHKHEESKKHEDHGHGSHSGHNPGHGEMGHDHHKMMIEDFKKRFWLTLILTIPILAFSPMIQNFLGYEWLLPGNSYILPSCIFMEVGLSLKD